MQIVNGGKDKSAARRKVLQPVPDMYDHFLRGAMGEDGLRIGPAAPEHNAPADMSVAQSRSKYSAVGAITASEAPRPS